MPVLRSAWVLLGLTLLQALGLEGARAAESDDRVNIVIIYADDLGYGDLACYGHPNVQTPNLDRMAREGARLTAFYSSCPYCAPSRASLMTGRYPFRAGMLRNPTPSADYVAKGSAEGDRVGLPTDELTLGEVLQQSGYRTACYGKWHLGHLPKYYPTRNGFHEYYGILYSNDMHPVELREGEEMVEFPVDQSTLARRYTERSLRFIEENRDRPFLLYLAHAMPHKPLAASAAFYQKTGTGLYGDVIAELDWSVGQVLEKLAQCNLEGNTLVFFTSDNGPWYGGSTGGLRGMKGQWWEGGIRIPLIARWPGRIPAGHVSHQPAIIMDLFVTSLAAAGLQPPDDRILDGRNILPLLTSDAASPHQALFTYHDRVRSVRAGHWKLHAHGTPPPDPRAADWVDPRAPNGKTILGPSEQYTPASFPGVRGGDHALGPALFDLQVDPAEQRNVAGDHPDTVARLMTLLEEMQRIADDSRRP
jgi:uncharacterized sulfatase